MRPSAAAAHRLVHEAAIYDGDEQLLDLVVPFVQEGLNAGEPTVVALDEQHTELVGSIIPASPHVSFVPRQYDRPATVLRSLDTLLTEYLSQGARQIRVVGQLPPPALGVPWAWWSRYEATVNHALAQFPVWAT